MKYTLHWREGKGRKWFKSQGIFRSVGGAQWHARMIGVLDKKNTRVRPIKEKKR